MAQTIPEPEAGARTRRLPPLILHPFSDHAGSAQFLEGSRASLMLAGLLPADDAAEEELTARVLRSRYLEIRMLYFLGKDLARWIEQCVEQVERSRNLEDDGLREQSFAAFLTRQAPAAVEAKLRAWGVHDFGSIFVRALGLHSAFAQPPEFAHLSRDFILNYHRYADYLFACYQQLKTFTEPPPGSFEFELYGSGEYSRLLEEQWREPE